MPRDLQDALNAFTKAQKFNRKGPLCVALVMTQQARNKGLPLDSSELLTEGGGQVLGLGKGAVQTILHRHDITRVLASEGGRTSRGSIGNMREYVAFLNQLHTEGAADLDAIEGFWIARVHEFFAAKPFRIRLDASRSLRTVVRDVLGQAEDRQKTMPGVYYAGAVMQHMVGAKLDCALGQGQFEHNSYSTSDQQSGRKGDFLLGDVAIHVTTSPGEAVIERCRDNLNDGLRPVLVTGQRGLTVAEGLADNAGLGERIDVFEVEQFIALNLYEMGKFGADGRRVAVSDFVTRYNEIVEDVETDPSLKIEFRQ
ncbi:MAG: DUF4928 family protein [Beijerinckiaceae bacterium]